MKIGWKKIIRQPSLRGTDPIFDAFTDAWCALTDEQRERFVDEGADVILYFDAKCRLQPGPGFTDDADMVDAMAQMRPVVMPPKGRPDHE